MLCGVHSLENYNETFDKSNSPEIMITILIRNKAYSLPYFLYYLENLDYDKSKIMLWFVYVLLQSMINYYKFVL